MKKTVVGFAGVMLSALSFGAWYDNPMLKAKVDLGAYGDEAADHRSDPHYISLSECGSFLLADLNSWDAFHPVKFFDVQTLAAADGAASDCSFRTVPSVSGQAWKGGAVSERWGVAVIGSGSSTTHAVLSLDGSASGTVALGKKSDGLDFDAVGNLYGNDGDARKAIVRFAFSSLSAAGGTFTAKAFETSLTRVRNVSVYAIGGRTLVFAGEGDSTVGTKGKVIAVDVTDAEWTEYPVVTTALASDIMNVKVSGVAGGAPVLHVTTEAGEYAAYQLAADGRSATPTPLKTLSAADFNALFGTTVASGGFRSLEVTDDGSRAFLVAGQRYTDDEKTYIYVLQNKPTELQPIAYYSFEDKTALGKDFAGDHDLQTLLGNDATPVPVSLESGKVGKACTITRASVTGAALVSETAPLSGNGACTYSCWVRPSSSSSSAGYLMMQKYMGEGPGKPGAWGTNPNWTGAWYIRFPGNGKLQFAYNGWRQTTDDGTAAILATIASGKYNDGAWHHVAFTHDGAGKITLYWDGAAVKSKTIFGFSIGANTRLLIGSYENGNYFSGDYDEVKVYDVARSADEIKSEYEGRKSVYVDLAGNTVVEAEAGTTVSTTLSAATDRNLIKTGAGAADVTAGDAAQAEVWSGTLRTVGKGMLGSVGKVDVAAGSVFEIGRTDAFGGAFAGNGTVRFSGLGKIVLSETSPLALAGVYRLYAANVDVGADVTANPALDIANGGSLNFLGDASVRRVEGAGICGAVSVADGKTLAVDDPAKATYAGALKGAGTVEKNGAGELVLEKSPEVANLAVNAGQVTLDRALPYNRKGLVAYWDFDDAANLGADVLGKADLAEARTADGAITSASGHAGAAVSLRKGATTVASALITDAGAVPTGTKAFSVSAWIRPNGDSAPNAYLLVCRKVTDGYPTAFSGNWNGWVLRFHGGGYLAWDFQSGWRDPADDAQCAKKWLSSTVCKDGKWHHVAITRDADLKASIYWDGALLYSKTLSKNQDIPADVRLSIGGQDSGNSFSGDYDEVKVFDRALAADEVAAEFATTRPIEDSSLPAPDAHWTFDEIAEENGKKLFKDASANAIDLKNTANAKGEFVECVTGEGINGGAAYLEHAGAYLQLDDGKSAAEAIQATWPSFTISARIRNVSATGAARKPLFCIGNAKGAQGCVRLTYEGRENTSSEPQVIRVMPGDANGGNGFAMTDTLSTADANAPWTTVTLVNDHQSQTMWIYRDGALVETVSTAGSYTQSGVKTAMSLDMSRLDVGYNTYGTYSGYLIDDLRIYKKLKPTAAQVKEIVLGQAGLLGAPTPASAVTLAPGAKLSVKGGTHAVAAVSGAGTVDIASRATFGAVDWSGFTGGLTGAGRLALYAKLPATLDIGARETIAVGVVTDKAGSGLPLIKSTGKVAIAETGVFKFTDVVDANDLPAGRFVIAEAASFDAPADFSGWKLVPSNARTRYEFKLRNGKFLLSIKGGTEIIIR